MLKSMTSLVLALALGLSLAAGERKPVKPVNPNTATVTELMQLPGVGAKTAERILEYRKQHGPFQRLEDLMNVKASAKNPSPSSVPTWSRAPLRPRRPLPPGSRGAPWSAGPSASPS